MDSRRPEGHRAACVADPSSTSRSPTTNGNAQYKAVIRVALEQTFQKVSIPAEAPSAIRQKSLPLAEKVDRLDEAFLFERSIEIEDDRHAEKLREELTLVRIERHSVQLEELDVEGILGFAERVLSRAEDLWVQASLEQRQRFQQLFFPEGIAFDGKRFVRTAVAAPAFSYLRPIEGGSESLVDQTSTEPWSPTVSGSLQTTRKYKENLRTRSVLIH